MVQPSITEATPATSARARGGEQAEDDGEGARRGHTDNDRAYVLDAPANALVNWNVHFLILESGIL